MHILIDIQGLQSESKVRGIGRYTLELTRAIINNCGQHRISLLLNGLYPIGNINDAKAKFHGLVHEKDCYVFSAVGPIEYRNINNIPRNKASRQCREAAIAEIAPDIVLISTFFEGYTDDFIVSISENVSWKTFVICYDLIPLLNKERYLCDPLFEKFYMNKVSELRKVDGLLAISESSRQEFISHANIDENKIINISSAASDDFRQIELSEYIIQDITQRFQLPEKFILSLAMIDSRKNIETLIFSYGKLSEELQNEYPLVLAYKVNPEDKKRIIELAQDNGVNINSLVFTGYLNDQDLIVLYNLCTLFVFPSLHEGFGLPPLEAMKCGAATIASGTTSLPEVIGWDGAMFDPRNPDAICTLICKALTDEEYYSALKENARIQAQKFSWNISAERAIAAMEKLLDSQSQSTNRTDIHNNIVNISEITELTPNEQLRAAWAIARNNFTQHKRKILVDISVLVHHDAKTGIQRVSRSILTQLRKIDLHGYEVYPVYYTHGEYYRYANRFTADNFDSGLKSDNPVLFTKDDILLVADLTAHLFPDIIPEINYIRKAGAKAVFIVYDILPILHPEWCAESIRQAFPLWLKGLVSCADQLICISESVANEVRNWIDAQETDVNPYLMVDSFHLGADFEGSLPSKGMPETATAFLAGMSSVPTFLMVGTLEPRKGHSQTLAAFKQLWSEGYDFQLCIVGKQGWNVESLISEIENSDELNNKLFWLQNISDEYLDAIYANACALIFASNGEGFGLPLIEAAQKNIPLIIRDIPVFKEIAESNAFYFHGQKPDDLKNAIIEWHKLYTNHTHPTSAGIKWQTWRQSVEQLLSKLPITKEC